MAKENNTGRPKRSHSYKPYDASNSSFVKRITSRVSEILPGPSWISRWLAPTPQINRRDRDDEEDEEEEEKQQPPVKRIRLQTSFNDYIQQNRNKRLSDLQENPEELSPISRVDHHDGAVAGPSGLQIRHTKFVSSTPATTQTSSAVVKVNAVDEGSDSSESTSGCSSLVPQDKRTSSNAVLSKLTAETHKVLSPGAVRTLSTAKDKYSKMNLCASSVRPSFDHYVFHNPHNKSMNSSRSSQLDDSSTFYRGRTMYGGASACRESLNMSIMSSASKPRVTNVKPVSRQGSERDTIGTSALRILRALEQISSPVTEAKKMPLNESQRRRKPIQPFDELMIPQMPALLRLKRRQRSDSAPSKVNETKDKNVADSSLVNCNEQPPAVPTSTEKTTTQLLPSYSFRKEESNKKEKYVASIKGKSTEELENERVQEVNLPNVKLNISSLPTFSLPPANKTVKAPSTPSFVSNIHRPPTSESSFPRTSPLPFKFSDPIVESTDGHRISSIKPTFTFSNPLNADSLIKENELQNHNKLSKEKSSLKQDQNKIGSIKTGASNPKLKRKSNQQDKVNAVAVKQSTNLQHGSVMDFFHKTNSEIIGKDKSKTNPSIATPDNPTKIISGPNDKSKSSTLESIFSTRSSDNKWSCNKCLVENNNSDNNCVKCGISKLRDSKNKESSSKDKVEVVSSDFIECKTCAKSYKAIDNKCPTCTVTKSDVTTANNTNVTSTSSSVPLSVLFKKSAGSWECNTCLVTNKSDAVVCVSCSTPQPGATPKPAETTTVTPSFQFGIPSSTTDTNTGGFTFGFVSSNNDNKGGAAIDSFKFGSELNSSKTTQDFKFGSLPSASVSEAKVTFSFGCPPQDTKKKETEQSEYKSFATKFTFSSVSASEKVNEKEEDKKIQESSKDNPPPKKVSFSQQLVQEKTITSDIETDSSGSSFNFTNNPKSDIQSSTTFSFPSKTPIFSNITPPSSKSDNRASNTLFKFGTVPTSTTTATSTSAVTISTVSATDNSVKIPSTLSSNSDKEKASSTFSFLSNSAPKPLFSSSEKDKKEVDIFGGFPMNNKTSQFNTNVTPLPTNFTFGTSSNENKTNSEKDVKKDGISNSIFGDKRENEQTLFNLQPQNEEKPNIFGSSKNESKPVFFNANVNENINIFGSAKAEDWNPKPAFGSETFEPKPAVATSATPFCTSTTGIPNNTETKNEPFTFNATTFQTNSITPFIFEGTVVPDNKPSSGFSFNAPNSAQIQNTNVFGTNSQPTPNVFGPTSSLFNTTAQPNNTAGPSFTFGAPQQQQSQGIFCFSASSQVAPSGAASMGETFTFGSQNAVPQSTPAATPAVPPTFDPNIKPNFNFSGGATPSFSAQSSGLPSSSSVVKDRKIRKAVRRTLRNVTTVASGIRDSKMDKRM